MICSDKNDLEIFIIYTGLLVTDFQSKDIRSKALTTYLDISRSFI
jgi:hypothetical protein